MSRVLVISILLLGQQQLLAQPTPVLTTDKTKILIGEPFLLTLELKAVDRNTSVSWNLPDSLVHFQYLSIDTTNNLKRTVRLTSWDSGWWKLEPITVSVPSSVDGKPQLIQFPPKRILVEYDTTGSNLMNDVKPIIEVEEGDENWIGYLVTAAAIISFLLLYYLLRKKKAAGLATAAQVLSHSAYEAFLHALQELQVANWSNRQQQKQGFAQLRLALQQYLERSRRLPFSTYTTEEVTLQLQPALERPQLLQLAQVLRLTDAVLFARFTAPEETCQQTIETMQEWARATQSKLAAS